MNLAPIGEALALYRAIIYECKGAGLDITTANAETIADVLTKNIDALLNILGSELVMEAIKGCMAKVLYDGQRFSMDIFDNDTKARGDFFPLLTLVAVENLRPFFPQVHTILNAIESLLLKS